MLRRLLLFLTAALLTMQGGAPCTVAARAASGDSWFTDDPLVLAPAALRTGAPIDGIPSGPMLAEGYHVHAHLALYVDGRQAWVPAGVGVVRPVTLYPYRPDPVIVSAAGFYWLHTHDESGVVHMESPAPRPFSLGDFFDIWGQPLSDHQVGPKQGPVTAYVDGVRWTADPRLIALGAHTVVQLDVGQDVPFQPYDFPAGF